MKSIQDLRTRKDEISGKLEQMLSDSENGRKWTDEHQAEYDAALRDLAGVQADIDKIVKVQANLADRHMASLGHVDLQNCVAVYQDTQTGKNLPVLGPQHKLTAHASGSDYVDDTGMRRYSIGDFMKAMAVGTTDQNLRNAMEEGTSSAGGITVPDYILKETFDLARAKNHMIQAGMRTIPLETKHTTMVKLTSDPSAAWRLENSEVGESSPTFDGVVLQPQSLAVLVKMSVELMQDSPNAQEMLTMALSGAMAAEIDRVGLLGTGTDPEPEGILNTAGINEYDMGADGAAINGFTDVMAAYQLMANANSAEATGLIMSPRERFSYSSLTDTTGQPLRKPDLLENIPFLMTSKIPIDDTHGAATNASNMYLGDYTKALLGLRQGMRIEVLKERFMDHLQIGFICHLRADIALSHPDHFTVIKGVIPA